VKRSVASSAISLRVKSKPEPGLATPTKVAVYHCLRARRT
jgi:hypothetical protein